jgi:uncharacterized protein YeaO (DUF488 family)
MLRQASVSDLINDRVSRGRNRYVVITMRRYPRFVNRAYRDEYVSEMSPDWPLFEDWLSAKRRHGDHNGAFEKSGFEERFSISEAGLEHLARLVDLSLKKDVYFVCSCKTGQRCHRELVLMIARKLFKNADVEKPLNSYPIFAKRLALPKNEGKIVREETHARKVPKKKVS